MNAEGVAPIVTPEWLITLATGLPLLVAMGWLIWLPLVGWRHTVWRRAGPEIRALAARWDATVRPGLGRWRLDAAERRVVWSGGLWGLQTAVHVGRRRATFEGLLSADAVCAHVDALAAMD